MAAQGDAQDGSWLTLSEAAERSGLHKEALRAKAKRGQLESRKNNRGETLVMLPTNLLTAAQSDGQGAAQGQAEQLVELVRDLEGELGELRTELARAEGKIETAQAVAAADIRTAQAEVQAKDQVIAELRALLAEARRPWWRRWLG